MTSPSRILSPPLVYVIVLNWNRPADTVECVRAVCQSQYSHLHTLIVDNHSSDDSVSQLRAAFPDIQIFVNPKNLGYAEGNNVGIRWALQEGAEHVLLLNDDAFVEPGTIAQMVSAATLNVAAVGCKVRLWEDAARLWAAGECFPRGKYPVDNGEFDDSREIRYAVGCCILMTRPALEAVGLLDGEMFAVHEEKDWCYRARAAGFRIVYNPMAAVNHKVGSSFTTAGSAAYHYLFVRNQLLFWRHSDNLPMNWRWINHAWWLWRQEIGFIRHNGGAKLRRAWGATWGVVDYGRGRFGPPPETF